MSGEDVADVVFLQGGIRGDHSNGGAACLPDEESIDA